MYLEKEDDHKNRFQLVWTLQENTESVQINCSPVQVSKVSKLFTYTCTV